MGEQQAVITSQSSYERTGLCNGDSLRALSKVQQKFDPTIREMKACRRIRVLVPASVIIHSEW